MSERVTRVGSDLRLILRYWWAIVVTLVVGTGFTLLSIFIHDLEVPLWGWVTVALSGVPIATFLALHKRGTELDEVARERDALTAELKTALARPTGPRAVHIEGGENIRFIDSTIVGSSHGLPASPAPLDAGWLNADEIENRTLWVGDIPRPDGVSFHGKTFKHCTIRGPGILALRGHTRVESPTFAFLPGDVESMIWARPRSDEQYVWGPIWAFDCTFIECTFDAIGLTGTDEHPIIVHLRSLPPENPELLR